MSGGGTGLFVKAPRSGNRGAIGKAGWIVAESGCHIWTGARDRVGYGMMWDPKRKNTYQAHRVRYLAEVGPIPEGLVLDHYVCDNGPGGCCNPLHCRPVTQRENLLRGNTVTAMMRAKTHCKRGHLLAGDNLDPWTARRGWRKCAECNRQRMRDTYVPKKERL